jgi:hypothetical protein
VILEIDGEGNGPKTKEGLRIGEGVDDCFHRRGLADEWKKSRR